MMAKDFRNGIDRCDYGMTVLEIMSRQEKLNTDKLYAKLCNWAACCAHSLGQFRGAFEYWEKAITRDPQLPDAHYNLASLLANTSHLESRSTNTLPDLPAARWHCRRAIDLWAATDSKEEWTQPQDLLDDIDKVLQSGFMTPVHSRYVTVRERPFGMKVGESRKVLRSTGPAREQGVERGDEVYKIDGRKVEFHRFLNLFKILPLPFDVQLLPRHVSEKLVYQTPKLPSVNKYAAAHLVPDIAAHYCRNYTASHYRSQMMDRPRVLALWKAVNQTVFNKSVVEIGCGPGAFYARKAVAAGARHVYAIEANKENYLEAKKTIQQANMQDKISLLEGYSTEVDLPEKAEVLIHDNFGEMASLDGCVRTIKDALRRLVLSKAKIIPSAVSTYLAPCEVPRPLHLTDELDPVARSRNPNLLCILGFPQSHTLASFEEIEDIQFGPGLADGMERNVTFTVSRAGTFEGLVSYISLRMGEIDSEIVDIPAIDKLNKTTTTTVPYLVTSLVSLTPRYTPEEKPSWWNLVVRFPETRVSPGDTISVQFNIDYGSDKVTYDVTAEVISREGEVLLPRTTVGW
ncbi:hypothetical protein AAMO2058_000219000 [Amorphochlora amoebiformis]